MSSSEDINDIRQRMQVIRREIGEKGHDIIDKTSDAFDWRKVVQSSPVLALGAAAVVGYLLIPSRPRLAQLDAKTLADLAAQFHNNGHVAPTPAKTPSIWQSMVGSMTGTLIQGGLAVASYYLSQMLQQQMLSQQPLNSPSPPGNGMYNHRQDVSSM